MITEQEVECPHCGEIFTTVVDTSQGSFSTIEDCWVCCRPMQIDLECEPGEVVSVRVERC